MTANPIDLIGGLTTAGNVSKADITAWGKARVAQVLADAAEVNNTILANQLLVILKSTGGIFKVDTTDTTTADNGTTVLVSLDGLRFKVLVPSSLIPTITPSLPKGRLTLQSGVPVMLTSQSAKTSIFYAPYIGKTVPIYNGTVTQDYIFTSNSADLVGQTLALGSNWAANTIFDVFEALQAGVPTLCTVAWASGSARATALALFDGLLTNATSATARKSNSSTFTLAANQGTYVGSFRTNGSTGTVDFTFGSAASGGGAASFNVWNYYNRRLTMTTVEDNGASYTYSANVGRQARASSTNNISFLIGVVEDAISASYAFYTKNSSSSPGAFLQGIGLNAAGIQPGCIYEFQNVGQVCNIQDTVVLLGMPALGLNTLYAMESGDGTSTATFNFGSVNCLIANMHL